MPTFTVTPLESSKGTMLVSMAAQFLLNGITILFLHQLHTGFEVDVIGESSVPENLRNGWTQLPRTPEHKLKPAFHQK